MNLGTLFDGLGCFPFDHGPYRPQSDSLYSHLEIQSLIEFSSNKITHQSFSALPSRCSLQRLAVKLFRGEPAIPQLDWNFSTTHKSSAVISTNVGSVLRVVLPTFQPAHG